jgi:putative ABC transport system substrate-binding protein
MKQFWILDFGFSIGETKNKKVFCLILCASLLVLGFPGDAQQTKIPRIGYLDNDGSAPPQAFVQGLRELGHVEGRNIAIEYRSANSKRDRTIEIAYELVRLKPDIIVADGTVASLAAKKATNTIPIVMTTSTDPIGNRLIANLSRPGGNVTGLTSLSAELGGKFLELLNEILPRLGRAGVLMTGGAANHLFIKETEPAARALGVS